MVDTSINGHLWTSLLPKMVRISMGCYSELAVSFVLGHFTETVIIIIVSTTNPILKFKSTLLFIC